MTRKVLILDTSILCVWLRVPHKDSCGPNHDRWDHVRVVATIAAAEKDRTTTFVLPLASIIETGNHIAQATTGRFDLAVELGELIRKSAKSESPWATFSVQGDLWSSEKLEQLASEWPQKANAGLSLGDHTIVQVAEYYGQLGYDVEILTGDQGLKAYQPTGRLPKQPRRRRDRSR